MPDAPGQTGPPDAVLSQAIESVRSGDSSRARRILLAAQAQFPQDARFPRELAGIAFREKDYSAAKQWIRRSLALQPRSQYSNEFLGTLYFLENNTEAAVKYWNRAEAPRIQEIRFDPPPNTDSILLDRALTIAPASVLQHERMIESERRLRQLNLFSDLRFDLLDSAAKDSLNLVIRVQEPVTWKQSKLFAAARLLRGLPDQTLYPEFYNIAGTAITSQSLVRSDVKKQRLAATVTRPSRADPAWRFDFTFDGRKEQWLLVNGSGFTGSSAPLQVQRYSAGFGIRQIVNWRCGWRAGAELNNRVFRTRGQSIDASIVSEGAGFAARWAGTCDLLRLPEHRMLVQGQVAFEYGRVFASPHNRYLQTAPRVWLDWFPQPTGDDYRTQLGFRGGASTGDLPLDRFFVLGLDQDDGIPLRGHAATTHGGKGRAALARSFFLMNSEMDKNLFSKLGMTLTVGPFFDLARVTSTNREVGRNGWFYDAGVQVKLRVFREFGVVFSYGRDLRGGNDVWDVGALY